MSEAKPVIFISYSHKDPAELEYVRSHLGPIASLGSVSVWDDNKLQIGDDWKGDIDSAIDACAVFVLLVSRYSLNSKFILEVEIPRIIPRWQSKQVRFCPIVVTPCHMEGFWWLDALNRRPKNDQALSELSDAARDREMKAIVGDIARYVSASVEDVHDDASAFGTPRLISSRQSTPDIVDYDRLPETPYKTLVGRDPELTALDEAWIDKLTNIFSLVAWGGAGKTALLNEWLLQMRGDNYRGAAAVLGWSFYSQGTKERATSAEGFLDWALKKLSVTVTSNSATTKAEKLAEAIAQRRILLVLDGMEPLQHGPDGQEGYLKDQGMRTFLRRFAAMPPASANGLIIITSRLEIRDIEALKGSTAHRGPHRNMVLHRLSDEAGAALLKDNGVAGSENERQIATHEFDGHALALSLLASYLTELHGGDIRRRDHVRALLADSKNPGHGHAWRVMDSYEREWLQVNPLLSILAKALGPKYFPRSFDKLIMRSILSVVGLFDRPASVDCLEALRSGPAIRGLTEVIVNLDGDVWNHALARLRKTRLIDPKDGSSPGAIDAHPLIREWFGNQLKQTNGAAWKAAHSRLYEHLRDTTKEGNAPTLDDLAPLYQAIAHGCRADRCEEALDEIYIDRISRRRADGRVEFYSSKRLGAIGSNLAAISWFFDKPFETPAASLELRNRSWVIGEAAYYLRMQGRFAEALSAERAGLRTWEAVSDWVNAAACASNLSATELLVGEIQVAVTSAVKSVTYANRSQDNFQMMGKRTTHASALHALGQRADAEALFADAEHWQRVWQPAFPFLYALQGYRYCDLFLDKHEWALARERAQRILDAENESDSLLARALVRLTLGRANLGILLTTVGLARMNDHASSCGVRLDEAVDGLRVAGATDNLPRGLLARAAFRRSVGDWDGDARDLDEVEEIAEPAPMKPFLCDMALERVRLAFAKIDTFAPLNGLVDDGSPRPIAPDAAETARLKEEAAKQLAIAADFIKTCGYHRRDEELAELQAVLRGERKFADLPPRV